MIPYYPNNQQLTQKNFSRSRSSQPNQLENRAQTRQQVQNYQQQNIPSYYTTELDTYHPTSQHNQISNMHNQIVAEMQQHSLQMQKQFEKMQNKMMKHFDNDFGGGKMMKPFSKGFGGVGNMISQMEKEFDSMMKFSGLHDDVFRSPQYNNKNGGASTVISRSYVSSTKLDQNGQKHGEKYYSNNVVQKGFDGQTISERQQAYQNTAGHQKIAQERMLNEQGRKFVQERYGRNNEIKKANVFYNMNENDIDSFDNKWNNYNEKIGFTKNNYKILGHNPNAQYLVGNEQDAQRSYNQYNQQQQYSRQNNQNRKQPYQKQNTTTLELGYKSKPEDYIDDARRGQYLPDQYKNQHQPVRINKQRTYDLERNYNLNDNYGRVRQPDIQPIMLGGGGQQAIPLGNAAIGGGQQNNQYQAPAQRQYNPPAVNIGGNNRIGGGGGGKINETGVFKNKGNGGPQAG